MLKKAGLYAYFVQKSVSIKHIFIKLDDFLIKEEKSLEKYNEMWEKVSNIIKRNLIVNLHIIKKNLRAEKKNQRKRRLSM